MAAILVRCFGLGRCVCRVCVRIARCDAVASDRQTSPTHIPSLSCVLLAFVLCARHCRSWPSSLRTSPARVAALCGAVDAVCLFHDELAAKAFATCHVLSAAGGRIALWLLLSAAVAPASQAAALLQYLVATSVRDGALSLLLLAGAVLPVHTAVLGAMLATLRRG